MMNKQREKIQKLLALANDANDKESMTALLKAQQLMMAYNISETEMFDYHRQQQSQTVIEQVIYEGRPHKWLYELDGIIAQNFRVKFYYEQTSSTKLFFLGVDTDVQIAEITFHYAKGSVSYCAQNFMKQREIKRKYKRKWVLKRDYIQGYLKGLSKALKQQVITNGYELALQLPQIVTEKVQQLNLVAGKDTSHEVNDYSIFYKGYQEGLKFKSRELIEQ